MRAHGMHGMLSAVRFALGMCVCSSVRRQRRLTSDSSRDASGLRPMRPPRTSTTSHRGSPPPNPPLPSLRLPRGPRDAISCSLLGLVGVRRSNMLAHHMLASPPCDDPPHTSARGIDAPIQRGGPRAWCMAPGTLTGQVRRQMVRWRGAQSVRMCRRWRRHPTARPSRRHKSSRVE